ncbi:hypothetical protein N0V83_004336 [Neocucurbitaria cava]|uniref:Uncharacterized protein n=1 Tax=Neocucurbitaria cava TaxID=798079 RepID=A0A9W8Y8R3_9PLEO|nr:hypothetical protein N0V83_004336 [Neocucurbitaria cava]
MTGTLLDEDFLAEGDEFSSIDKRVIIRDAYIFVGWTKQNQRIYITYNAQPSRASTAGVKIDCRLNPKDSKTIVKKQDLVGKVSWMHDATGKTVWDNAINMYRKVLPTVLPPPGVKTPIPSANAANPANTSTSASTSTPAISDKPVTTQKAQNNQNVLTAQNATTHLKRKSANPTTTTPPLKKAKKAGNATVNSNLSSDEATEELFNPAKEPNRDRLLILSRAIYEQGAGLKILPPPELLKEIRTFYLFRGRKLPSLSYCKPLQRWLRETGQHVSQRPPLRQVIHPLMARLLACKEENRRLFTKEDFGEFDFQPLALEPLEPTETFREILDALDDISERLNKENATNS